MPHARLFALVLGLCLVSAGCSQPAGDTAEPAPTDRPGAVAQCIVCHSFERDGPTRIGPNLWGVYGKPAGGKPGYAYSGALRQSGLVWDQATLDAFLENPRTTLPGSKMSYAGMRDPAQRAEIIAYLRSLSEE